MATNRPAMDDEMAGPQDKSNRGKGRCVQITLIVLGVILLITGIVLLFELKRMVHNEINRKIPLSNGTDTYNAWVDPPVPVYMQFWLYDLVNAEDYVNNGTKPILRELGPYTYREERPKEDLAFSADETLISYIQPRTYVFVPEMSNGTENDTFTSVNFPLLTVATMLRFWPKWIQVAVRNLLSVMPEKLFTEYTVHGYLWGFDEPILTELNKISQKFIHKDIVKDDEFGLFHGPTGNGTNDGEYTVYTGHEDIDRYNLIYQWKNSSSLPYWNSTYCNMINGSDGSGWHPFIDKSEKLYIFSSDICRSIYATYVGDTSVEGIKTYRFTPPASVLQNPDVNPDNLGYCTPDCLKAGVLNVSSCKEGAPLIVSQPHFYQGDQSYIDAFVGLRPDPTQHATILDVEPYTGVVLKAAKKLQINFYIRKLESIKETLMMENDTIFPVLWLNESAVITHAAANDFKHQVLLPVRISVILPWILIAVGVLLVVIGIILVILAVKNDRDNKVPAAGVSEDETRQGLLENADSNQSYNSTVQT